MSASYLTIHRIMFRKHHYICWDTSAYFIQPKNGSVFAVYKTHLRATRSSWSSKNIKFSFLQSLRSNRGVRLQVLIKLWIFSTFIWAFNILTCRSSTRVRICCIYDHTSEAQHIDTTLCLGHEITNITNNYNHIFDSKEHICSFEMNPQHFRSIKLKISPNKIKIMVTEKKKRHAKKKL